MKTILILTLLALARTITAAEPLIIAPLAVAPNFQPAVPRALSLTPTMQVYPTPVPVRAATPVPVRAVRPAMPVAVPVRR